MTRREPRDPHAPSRAPTLETLFVATMALLGLRLGLRPIGDNSFFTHLRTGIDIVDGLGIPRRDPYSFTALGEPWVVQSWLASVVYGLLDRLGGGEALVLFHGVAYGSLGWLVATLARASSALRTATAAVVATGIGLAYWAPRPLAVGLLALAVVVLVVERCPSRAWLLLPLAWVWANSHGSFVLGGLWLLLLVLTGRADARRPLGWFVAGCAAAAVNPLGPKLLLFPLTLFTKRANFTRVIEWRPPTSPDSALQWFSLVCVACAVGLLCLALSRRRLRPLEALPALVFLALGLVSQRNLAPAGIVVAPVLARALRTGSLRPSTRSAANVGFAALLFAVGALFVLDVARREPLDLDGYPPLAALAATAGAERIVTTDVAGGYRILLEGRDADVFFDDRYDMYPETVVEDYLALLDGEERWRQVVDRWRVDALVWPLGQELSAELPADPSWRRAFEGEGWVVYLREG